MNTPAAAGASADTPETLQSDVTLDVRGLDAGYGRTRIVTGLGLTVGKGEVVAVLGPNGAGKTTSLLTIGGYLPALAGRVSLFGQDVVGVRPHVLARRGVSFVHEDRALFGSLSVRENLQLAQRDGSLDIDEVAEIFPALWRCLNLPARALSGGEQQMLALGRAFIQRPRLLLIDEMSMGLAPIIVDTLLRQVRSYATETGASVVLVEQHVNLALRLADRSVVLAHGEVVLAGTGEELLADPERLHRAYLGAGSG